MDRKHRFLAPLFVASISMLLDSAEGRAAVILGPVSASTDMGESAPIASVTKMIDQSGLDKPFESGVTDWNTYFTTGDPPFAQAMAGNNWQSVTQFTLPVTGTVDFDFGAVHLIDRLAIWNISMKDIKILVSDASIDTVQEVGSFALPNHLNFPFSYSHDLLDLGETHDVRFMRIEIDSVHLFSPSDTFGFAIVGEVVASANPPSAGVDGDYNGNGTVDAADYAVWRDTLDQVGVGLPADGDGDGSIGPGDYDVWRMNFGDSSGAGAGTLVAVGQPVPEPASILWWVPVALAPTFMLRCRSYELGTPRALAKDGEFALGPLA